jgi:hypothetical protein
VNVSAPLPSPLTSPPPPPSSFPGLSLTRWQLPFWALISFGAYLLFKLGWGVFTFNDVPQAHAELMQQIAEARKDLQAKGVDVGED